MTQFHPTQNGKTHTRFLSPEGRGLCSKRSRGFSLVEMLAATVVGAGVIGSAFTLIFFNRNLYLKDGARTEVNQNLRTALDLTGIDIRQAGELLPADFPAIVLNPAGDTGDADRLILYRGLTNFPLIICDDITAGTGTDVAVGDPSLTAATAGGSPCLVDSALDTDISSWVNFRTEFGGTVDAYIYDPVNLQGEFFEYDGEDLTNYTFSRSGGNWSNAYLASDFPRLYLLEKRELFLSSFDTNSANCFDAGDILTLVINDDCDSRRYALTDQLDAFQVNICIDNLTTTPNCLAEFVPTASADDNLNSTTTGWVNIASVDVSFTGTSEFAANQATQRTANSSFFPRNILSFSRSTL